MTYLITRGLMTDSSLALLKRKGKKMIKFDKIFYTPD